MLARAQPPGMAQRVPMVAMNVNPEISSSSSSEEEAESEDEDVPDDDEGDYSRSTDAHNVRREFGVFAIWVEEAIGYHIVDQQVYWYHHWR